MKLKKALIKYAERDFKDFSSILDWGCGCGRITRFFYDLRNSSIAGVDIDPDNISWCKKHLDFADFKSISLSPPTNLASGSFDLVIGVSVFTHLKEDDEIAWLKELKRLAADNAFLLMTIASDMAIARANLSHAHFNEIRFKDFIDVGGNPELDSTIEDKCYYRNTFHSHHYIYEKWTRYFEIVDIIPGCIGNQEDLIVMRNSKCI